LALRHLVIREIKVALKNPAFIASLILLFVFYVAVGGVTRVGVSQSVEEVRKMAMRIPVVVEESSPLIKALLQNLNASVSNVKLYQSVDEALSENSYVIVFPKGFTEGALAQDMQKVPMLKAVIKLDSLSQVSVQSRVSVVQSVRQVVSRLLPATLTQLFNITITQKEVALPDQNIATIVYNRVLGLTEVNSILGFSVAAIFVVAFVMGIATSYAATNTAMEKVEKAFEMLLAQPVPRREIVLAKILGSIALALLNAAVVLIAVLVMIYLMASPASSTTGNGATIIGFDIALLGKNAITYIVLPLTIGLIYSGAIGVILGSVSPDERTASVLSMPITFLYIGLGIAGMFLSLPINPVTAVIYGVLVAPLPYVFIISELSKNPELLAIGMGTAITLCIMVITIAIIIFNRDIVILGIRLPRRRKIELE
jgi:ABC-2 type transport system permease protein